MSVHARIWSNEPGIWAYEVVQDGSLRVACGWSRNWQQSLRQALNSRLVYERYPLERTRYESHAWDGDDSPSQSSQVTPQATHSCLA